MMIREPSSKEKASSPTSLIKTPSVPGSPQIPGRVASAVQITEEKIKVAPAPTLGKTRKKLKRHGHQ